MQLEMYINVTCVNKLITSLLEMLKFLSHAAELKEHVLPVIKLVMK